MTHERRRTSNPAPKKDFGAFVERFVIFAPPHEPFNGLTFAVSDMIDVANRVSTFGNPIWEATHEPAKKSAAVVGQFRNGGASCVGRTVMGDLGLFGITGENPHYGTPINPHTPEFVTGGSSSGSAVAVASRTVDFAIGIDTIGDVRIPASFCGIFGFRPSHQVISSAGIVPVSGSLDTVGFFTRDHATLHRISHPLMQQLNPPVARECSKQLIFADDLFQLSNIPKDRTASVVAAAVENRPRYSSPMHVDLVKHIASNVPSLKNFYEKSANHQEELATLRALSSVMVSLQRYEWKTNHGEWVKAENPKIISPQVSKHVLAANYNDIQLLHKVRFELRTTIQTLLKDAGILVIPTVFDPPSKVEDEQHSAESYDRALTLCSIASVSGCCQVTVPMGKHDGCSISVSFMSFHGADRFLLDMVLEIYLSILRVGNLISPYPVPKPVGCAKYEVARLLNAMGNYAYRNKQFYRAMRHYSRAIQYDITNASYYCNRAAVFMEFGSFVNVEKDSNLAITLGEKNVKLYLMRGTAREWLLNYEDALQDFRYALVLEPENNIAASSKERLRKLLSR